MLWRVQHASFVISATLIIGILGCINQPGTVGEEQHYIKDATAVYNSESRAHLDSLFRIHRAKEDSLYRTMMAQGHLSGQPDRAYAGIKYLERKLSGRQYALFDSIYEVMARDTPGLLPELKLEYLLLKAIKTGIQGRFGESDSLFQNLKLEGDRYFKPAHDLMLRITEKQAEMWRYDATNPEKALALLRRMDTVLAARGGFTRFHRNQLYTLATTHRILGQYDEALANALILRDKLAAETPVDSPYLMSVSKVLANIYTDMEDPDEANRFFEEHIRYNLDQGRVRSHDLVNFAIQLSRNYQFAKADSFLTRAEPLLQSAEDSFYYQRTMAYHLLHQHRQPEARPYLDWVRAYCSGRYDYQLCPSSTYWYGEYYDLTGRPAAAIPLYKEAASFVCGKAFDRVALPDLIGKKDIELQYSQLIRAHTGLYGQTGRKEDLDTAARYAALVRDLFDEVSLNFTGIDRLINFQIFHEAFGHGAQAHFLLWEKTRDSSHLASTFEYLERCKSSDWDRRRLLSTMDLNGQESLALQRLDEAGKTIHRLELELYHRRDSATSRRLQEANLEKAGALNTLQDSFPELYRVMAKPREPLNLGDLLDLSDSVAILFFHWNLLNSYEYMISKRQVRLKVHFNSIGQKDSIDTYTALVRRVINRSERDEDRQEFLGRALAEKWLSPFYGLLQDALIVIPDGPLHNLSLEQLAELHEGLPVKKVRYSLSLADALLPEPDHEIQTILAVAYGHAEETEAFASLPGTIREVDGLQARYPGARIRYLKDREATRENFLKYAPGADLLYLATHAQSDPYNRFKNRLVFHGRDRRNEYLTAVELMQLPIHPKMVVLSACESGLGSYYKGSGNLSLVKAFKMGNRNGVVRAMMRAVRDDRGGEGIEIL